MKTKRLLSLFIAAAMMLSMSAVTAFANTTSGEADVPFVPTEVLKVTLPTNDAWNFTLDPQGLAGLADGATASAEDLAANAGKIIAGDYAPTVINLSSVPVVVRVAVKGTTTAGGATFVDTKAAVDADTDNDVLLAVVSSTAKVDDADTPFAGTFATALTTSDTTLTYMLEAATYIFKNTDGVYTYERDEADKGKGTQLQIAGLVNKKADWTNFNEPALTAKANKIANAILALEEAGASDVNITDLLPDGDPAKAEAIALFAAKADPSTAKPAFIDAFVTAETKTIGISATWSFDKPTSTQQGHFETAANKPAVDGFTAYGLFFAATAPASVADVAVVTPEIPVVGISNTVTLTNGMRTIFIEAPASFTFPQGFPATMTAQAANTTMGTDGLINFTLNAMQDFNMSRGSANGGTNNTLVFTLSEAWLVTGTTQGWTQINFMHDEYTLIIKKSSPSADTATATIVMK